MPELAEVEYYRGRWDAGLGQRILAVEVHSEKRSFRGNNVMQLIKILSGSTLLASEARGKQILFRFSRHGWLGVHLGMAGSLRIEAHDFTAGRHDHLVLRQRRQALCFKDARLFGRILFHHGPSEPDWWSHLPPALTSDLFTVERLREFLARHPKPPIKTVLLMQQGFPGIGNWMADEILWRTGISPTRRTATLDASETESLWHQTRRVCTGALRSVARDYSDPPPSWLFRHRWKPGGLCPKHKKRLARATIAGRTTVWCPKCQPRGSRASRPAR